MAQLGLPIDKQIEIICSALRQTWTPLPWDLRLISDAEKTAGIAAYIKSVRLKLGNRRSSCRQGCALLSGLTGVETEAIWQWGFIERLVHGLLHKEIGPEENAAEFLTGCRGMGSCRS